MIAAAPPAPSWLRWVARGSIVLGLAALAATIAIVGPHSIIDHLAAIGPWFGVLLAIELVATLCDATAIFLLTRGPAAPSLPRVVVAQFAGRAVNLVTPAANLGEALKIGLLARRGSTPRIIAAVLYAALAAVVVSLAIVALGTLVTATLFDVAPAQAGALVLAAVCAAALALVIVQLVRRGVLVTLAALAARLRLVSHERRDRWTEQLTEVDVMLRDGNDRRRRAIGLVIASQVLQKLLIVFTLIACGAALSPAQLFAVVSAGVVLGWIATLVPMGLGVAEGGNAALFALIGAPVSLGVALALARRVNQVVFAGIGFAILALDHIFFHLVPWRETSKRLAGHETTVGVHP